MERRLATADVARVLGLPAARIRGWVRRGFCSPERVGGRLSFSFQDLVVLRAARELVDQQVPAARVREALASLEKALPEDVHLAAVRVFADGRRVAVRDDTGSFDATTGQGLLDFAVAPLADAVAELHVAAESEPDHAEARQAFEQALALETSDPVAACRAYGRSLELDPEQTDAYVNLGRLALEAGDVRDAARLFHAALERSPSDAVIHFNLALALEDTSGGSSAAAHYERAIELDPDFADAHFNLAGLCEELGRGAEAIQHYRAYRDLVRGER
jgi:tetratricopeptide (TPR) repeat protein